MEEIIHNDSHWLNIRSKLTICIIMTIDKLSWILIKDKKVLFVRSRGVHAFYTPGGKRAEGESDVDALKREIKEELTVDLVPETLRYMHTFTAQAHGKPDGVLVEIKCYSGEYEGELKPSAEIEEIDWFGTKDKNRTSATGILILEWLKSQDFID